MPRRTFTFTKRFVKNLEDEARKRLLENTNMIGKRMLGSMARDIIIVCCCEKINLQDVKNLNKEEFKELIKKWKAKK